MAKRSKYNAKPQTIDGVKFASTLEANRYCINKLRQKAREISGLTPHPEFPLVVNGALVGHYTADSSYFKEGKYTVEEVKGVRVRDYALRCKLFRALHPDIEFVEIGGDIDSTKEWKALAKARAVDPGWIQRRGCKRPATTTGGHPE